MFGRADDDRIEHVRGIIEQLAEVGKPQGLGMFLGRFGQRLFVDIAQGDTITPINVVTK